MTPRLSVVIPVRNGKDFVGPAIASAQAVAVEPLEILVVDDGSKDGTLELLQRLAAEDPRIVVIRRDRDHGAAAARNEGIARARGAMICFLDADDILYPAPIAQRLAWHEAHPKVVLSFASHETLLPDGTVEPRFAGYWPRFEKFLDGRPGIVDLGASGFDLLFGENPVCTTGAMARREALLTAGGFAPELRMSQDWDMWIRLARIGGVAYSNVDESRHTVRDGALSGDYVDRARYNAEVMRKHWWYALRTRPATAFAALSLVEVARAEKNRARNRNLRAWVHYLFALAASPNDRQARDVVRATAVLFGLRAGRFESLEERAHLVALHTEQEPDAKPH